MDVRTTIRMPAELAAQAKRRAREEGITFTQLIQDAVRGALLRAKPATAKTRIELLSDGNLSKKLKWEKLRGEIEREERLNDLHALERGEHVAP